MEMSHFTQLLVKINKMAQKLVIARPAAPGAISLVNTKVF